MRHWTGVGVAKAAAFAAHYGGDVLSALAAAPSTSGTACRQWRRTVVLDDGGRAQARLEVNYTRHCADGRGEGTGRWAERIRRAMENHTARTARGEATVATAASRSVHGGRAALGAAAELCSGDAAARAAR